MVMGLFGLGRYARLVSNSIVVGFTIGIAVVIALSNIGEAFGLALPLKGGLISKLQSIASQIGSVNWYAFGLAIFTFLVTRILLKISVFIPAPLLAMALSTVIAATVFAHAGISTERTPRVRARPEHTSPSPSVSPGHSGRARRFSIQLLRTHAPVPGQGDPDAELVHSRRIPRGAAGR